MAVRSFFIAILCISALFAATVIAKLQTDLPADAALRVGVTFRPPNCEKKSQPGDRLSMHYTGRLVDGKEFDSSVGRSPFQFTLGTGQVIKGWDNGLVNMCEGEKRKLTIPSGLGYGSSGSGSIPGGATLLFDVELLKIDRLGSDASEETDAYGAGEL